MTKKEVIELAKRRAAERAASARVVQCPEQGTAHHVLPDGTICRRRNGQLIDINK